MLSSSSRLFTIARQQPRLTDRSHSRTDELRLLRNNFYLGSYAQVIAEAAPPPGGDPNPERAALYYRAHIASGNPGRASEIPPSAPAELQAVRHLAAYVAAAASGDLAGKASAVSGLSHLLADGANGLSSTVQAVAGGVYYQEERYADALSTVAKSPRNLEW